MKKKIPSPMKRSHLPALNTTLINRTPILVTILTRMPKKLARK